MAPNLTAGSLEIIMNGGTVVKPVMQILGTKKIGSGTAPANRYRILISDGVHVNSFAMLATKHNNMIESGLLPDFSIVQINQFITSMVGKDGQKRVMILLDLTVLMPGSEVGQRIGNPEPLVEDPNTAPVPSNPTPQASYSRPPQQNNPPQARPIPASPGMSTNDCQQTHTISSISPYQNRWIIKVRVTMKSPIRTWSNARGDGKLFSMDLLDESGEIRATAFNDQCDKFYEMIEAGKVYYLSRANLKTANKKFTSIKNDYEMSFTSETSVIPCLEGTDDIPTITFNFVPIDQIAGLESTAMVDVIGVCKSAEELKTVFAKTTNREITKRELTLVDTTNTSVSLTLWDTLAQEFDGSTCPVVAIKGARLSDFGGGRSVSAMQSSVIQVNPDIPEAHHLRGWFDNVGATQDCSSISSKTGGGAEKGVYTINGARQKQLGRGATADYFNCQATVVFIRTERATYLACPAADCNKKVVDQSNGMYRCEKCNKEYPNFKYRLLLNMNIADYTGSQWVTAFQDVGEKILGATAEEVGEASTEEGDKQKLQQIFTKASFKTYTFVLRAKVDTYLDNCELKVTAVEVKPVNFVERNKYLLGRIKKGLAILQVKI